MHILIIKLGALGDMVQASSSFKAIRAHHPEAHITLLTTQPQIPFAEMLGCFDAIWLDKRPKMTNWRTWVQQLKRLRKGHPGGRFDRVYDLQMVDRTNLYYLLWGWRRPEWCGVAPGCSHRFLHPNRRAINGYERFQQLLSLVGITNYPPLDISSHGTDAMVAQLQKPYVLLVPGASAAKAGVKCWTNDGFTDVVRYLMEKGYQPVLIGGPGEDNSVIAQQCPEVVDLTGKTDFPSLIGLARDAAFSIGGDTGPMHMAAASGSPVLVLFSGVHDPKAVGPRGPHFEHLTHSPLKDLSSQAVIGHCNSFMKPPKINKIS